MTDVNAYRTHDEHEQAYKYSEPTWDAKKDCDGGEKEKVALATGVIAK